MNFIKNKKVVSALVIISVICAMGVFALFWNPKKTKNNAQETLQEVTESTVQPTTEAPKPVGRQINFEELQSKNKDVYAWIEIPGTPVDYPMLQSADNMEEDYYLDHNLDHSSGYPGCIYTQKRNKKDFTDPVTVIYGHNMKNDTMFGILNEYKNREYFNEHNKLVIYTPTETINYKIFAAHIYTDKLVLREYADFASTEDFEKYVNQIKTRAKSSGILDEEVEISNQNKIITLATCVSSSDQRWFIQAVREDPTADSAQTQ